MDKQNVISYHTYQRIAIKHDVTYETITGKPVTYNKLKHRIDQFEHKKRSDMTNKNTLTEAVTEQQLYTNIVKYINSEIDDNELNNIMYHYIVV